MHRRRLLRVACLGTAALAGCSNGSDRSAPPTESEPTTPASASTSNKSVDADTTRNETVEAREQSTDEDGEGKGKETGTTHVATDGESGANGTREDPLDSIFEAVENAKPGETVQVHPGEYREEIHTRAGGSPGEPITIAGSQEAVVRPIFEDGAPRQGAILNINHSHVHLRGLTIDGLADPDRRGEPDWYGETVHVSPDDPAMEYLRDVVIMPHRVGHSRKSLVSLTRVVGAEIGGFEVIGPAGVQHLHGGVEGHNGEIVYLGTAIDTVATDVYPWDTVDETRDIHVHHVDNSAGHPHAELVDAKPGSRNVHIEYCSDLGGSGAYTLPGHDETDEAAVGLRGTDATLRYCAIENGNGQAVQVGVDGLAREGHWEDLEGTADPNAATDAGTRNAIYHNRLTGNAGFAILYPVDGDGIIEAYGPDAQRHVCGNEYDGDTHGRPDRDCEDVPAGDGVGHTGGDGP